MTLYVALIFNNFSNLVIFSWTSFVQIIVSPLNNDRSFLSSPFTFYVLLSSYCAASGQPSPVGSVNGNGRPPCHVPGLKGKCFYFASLNVWILFYFLNKLTKIPSIFVYGEFFKSHKQVLNLIECIFYIYRHDANTVFSFNLVA